MKTADDVARFEKEKPEDAIARTAVELFALGRADGSEDEADRLLAHLMTLVEDAKADATAAAALVPEAAFRPTVEMLTEALKRGDLVAKARASAKGFAIQFFDREGAERAVVIPTVEKVPTTPTTLASKATPAQGEAALRAALVAILTEECRSLDPAPLRARVYDRVLALVMPASETALVARQKADWFVGRAIGWIERREPSNITTGDLAALIDSLAGHAAR